MVGEFVNRKVILMMGLFLLCPPLQFFANAAKKLACEREPRKIIPSFDEVAAKVRARIEAGEYISDSAFEACSQKIQNCAADLSPVSVEDVHIFNSMGLPKKKKVVSGKLRSQSVDKLEEGADFLTCDRDATAAKTAAAVAIMSAVVEAEDDIEALRSDAIEEKKVNLRNALVSSALSCRDMEDFNERAGIADEAEKYTDEVIETAARLELIYRMCEGIKSASKRRGLKLEQNLLAALRAHSDLPMFALYEKWPGCKCSEKNKSSRKIAGVCFQGLTPSDPIDERIPKMMERYAEKLQAWAATKNLKLKTVQMGGCSFARLARGHGEMEDTFAREDISPHAESRACDLYSATFENIETKKEETMYFHDMRARKNKKLDSRPFATAFNEYLKWVDENKKPYDRRRMKRVALADASKGQIPQAIYDFRLLQEEFDKDGCPLESKQHCRQLEMGFSLIVAARDVGFLTVAPGVGSHDGHVHLSASTDAEDHERLSSGKLSSECQDKLIDYYVVHAAGKELPYPACVR